MATRTQIQFDVMSGCIHEQVCQAVYEQQRRRIQALSGWMAPDAVAARQLTMQTFVGAWTAAGEGARPDLSMEDRLAAAFASHFQDLFHREAAAPAHPPTAPAASMHAAVRALPAPHRLLYLLHELEGYSPARLGEWLQLEPAYCARLIHQARQQLRRALLAA